jgi:hypothetical protein
MDKKFRNLILAQVEAVVYDKPASRQSLYELLKIATPDLKLHAVDNTSQRDSAYRHLKILIHPDKHAKELRNDKKELQRVTRIFQETNAYYNVCCSRLGMESPGMSGNNSMGGTTMRTYETPAAAEGRSRQAYDGANISNRRDFRPPSVISLGASGKCPVFFDSYAVWPFMKDMVKAPADGNVSTNELAWIMACRVINLRGAVIHGQPIGRAYQVSKKSNELDKFKTVEEVLKHFGFVCRRPMNNLLDIKMEIMEHGPVVSTSFELHKSFYHASEHANKFSRNHVSKLHPLIIVGWEMTSLGELWKVQALTGETFQIGTGQFQVSSTVLAPPETILETIPWQSTGPYLDLNMPSVLGQSKDWRELRHMSIGINAKELETLSKMLEGGFQQAVKNKQSFVIRDKHKLAYSRRYTLREVAMGDNGKWKINVSQAEK